MTDLSATPEIPDKESTMTHEHKCKFAKMFRAHIDPEGTHTYHQCACGATRKGDEWEPTPLIDLLRLQEEGMRRVLGPEPCEICKKYPCGFGKGACNCRRTSESVPREELPK